MRTGEGGATFRFTCSLGFLCPLPIPMWTPFVCHPGTWTKGRGCPSRLVHAPWFMHPLCKGQGAQKKGRGAPLLGLCVPHSCCHCAQGGRGHQFPFPCGPPICMQMGVGAGHPSHVDPSTPTLGLHATQRCALCPHHSFILLFPCKGGDRGGVYPLHVCTYPPLFHDPSFHMPPHGEQGTCGKGRLCG